MNEWGYLDISTIVYSYMFDKFLPFYSYIIIFSHILTPYHMFNSQQTSVVFTVLFIVVLLFPTTYYLSILIVMCNHWQSLAIGTVACSLFSFFAMRGAYRSERF